MRTVFAFSTENWARSQVEVECLMALIAQYAERETPSLHENGVRLRFIGRPTAPVSSEVLERIERAEELTAGNERITLAIPLNYGGRAEIVDAARGFDGGGEEEFRTRLYAPELRDPQLVIRAGGERRLSNYLLWQVARSQLVFSDELWPDFDRVHLEAALAQYEGL